MDIVVIEPPKELTQVVRRFWYSIKTGSKTSLETYRILADGAPGIIFQHTNGRSSVFGKDGSSLPISF